MLPKRHITPAFDHPAHTLINSIDPHLQLRWNSKLERFEVWRHRHALVRTDNLLEFVMRITGDHGEYVEPGEWFLTQLRRRDPAFNDDLDDIVRQYREVWDREERAEEAAVEAGDKAARDEFIDSKALLIQRALTEDDVIGKPFVIGGPKEV